MRARLSCALAVVVGIALAGCSGNTSLGATKVAATSATLQASLQCDSGESCDGYFRWRAGGGDWVNGPGFGPTRGPLTLDRFGWTTPQGALAPNTTYGYQWCGRGSQSSGSFCVGPSAQQTSPGQIATGDPNRSSTFTTLPSDVTTVSAQQFHDSLGVNVKDTYWDTIYADWSRTLADVLNIGFTHIRVGIYDSSNAGWNARHWGDLRQAVARGLKLDVVISPDCSYKGTLSNPLFSDCFNTLRDQVGLAGVESFESPNEYDISGDPNWATNLTTWDPEIYRGAKALGPYPVYGPSIVNQSSIAPLGDQSASLDYGNFHDYRGATTATPLSVALEAARMQPLTGGKPDVATEFGYHNELSPTDPGAQPGIDEPGAAIYTLRQYLEHLSDGVTRSYVNQLYDLNTASTNSNERFGLIRSDGSYKPAATALKNLISMVGTGTPATLAPLSWGVEAGDQTSDLRYLDIAASDGSHDLVLWRTASVWDREAKQDLTVTPVPIHIDGSFAAWQQGDPLQSGALSKGAGPIALNLGADPIVLHIVPSGSGAAAPAAAAGSARAAAAPGAAVRSGLTRVHPRSHRYRETNSRNARPRRLCRPRPGFGRARSRAPIRRHPSALRHNPPRG